MYGEYYLIFPGVPEKKYIYILARNTMALTMERTNVQVMVWGTSITGTKTDIFMLSFA